MKNPHAPLLLLASLLAPGCAAQKPANFRDLVPEKAEELNALAKESEWMIIVTMDAERRVFFRKEQVGTTEDVGTLKERVQQVIETNQKKARDQGDEELAKSASTIFIKAPASLTYGEVSKVIEAVKAAGGSPVGLQEEDDSPQR
jgi:biopolymer transport protein ExbD